MEKTVKLNNGHEMSDEAYQNRVTYLWNCLAADGHEVHIGGKGDDSDIIFKMKEYKPKENFLRALGMGRYKVEVQAVDNRAVLKMNLC